VTTELPFVDALKIGAPKAVEFEVTS